MTTPAAAPQSATQMIQNWIADMEPHLSDNSLLAKLVRTRQSVARVMSENSISDKEYNALYRELMTQATEWTGRVYYGKDLGSLFRIAARELRFVIEAKRKPTTA